MPTQDLSEEEFVEEGAEPSGTSRFPSRYNANDLRSPVRQTSEGIRSRENTRRRYSQNDAGEDESQKPKISRITFGLMLAVAILFDLASFLINLIPFVGGAVSSITITPLATLTFFLWFKMHGVSYNKTSRWATAIITPIIEFIPVLNAFPTWILEVIIITVSVNAEETVEKFLKK